MLDSIVAAVLGMNELDERFIAHRHRSSRLALGVGVALIGAWFTYDLVMKDRIHIDLLVILLAMALTKVLTMAVLSRTD